MYEQKPKWKKRNKLWKGQLCGWPRWKGYKRDCRRWARRKTKEMIKSKDFENFFDPKSNRRISNFEGFYL